MILGPTLSSVGTIPLRTYAAGDARGRAAVLLFHGLRVSSVTLDEEARAFARAGITAVLVDAPHHGARRSVVLDTMPDTATLEGYRTLLRIIREARDEVPALVDHVHGLGYTKVAIAGVSLGGYVALAGATVEPRLAAIVSLLGSPNLIPHEGEAARRVEELHEELAESSHLLIERFPPRPLLLINGARDVNVRPEPARDLAARLRPLYDALGSTARSPDGRAELLVQREYDVDHFAPPDVWRTMVEEAVAFLSRVLL